MRFDVVVLGGGPAALAAAAACIATGLDVARVDPAPGLAWSGTYGVWLDELAGLGLESALAHQWEDVRVVAGKEHRLGRSYGLFDNRALADLLLERAAGAPVLAGRAVGANHSRWQSTVVLHDARLLDAAVLVDATGPWPAVVYRDDVIDGIKPAAVAATRTGYGVVIRGAGLPCDQDTCVLMDWSGGDESDAEPSFGSVFPLGDGWSLVQETSLAARPGLSEAVLEARLHGRLAATGAVVREVRAVDEAAVPLGLAVPSDRQRAVGFGAAAAMVHPLTGWSVGETLRAAPGLAAAIAAALERRATPAGVSAAAWGAVWPAERRRVRAIDQRALRALLRLDRGGLRRSFDALFQRPAEQWFAYLTAQATPKEAAATTRALSGAVASGRTARLAVLGLWPLTARAS